MLRLSALTLCALLLSLQSTPAPSTAPDGPAFTPDGKLQPPTNYREWIFLTSGLDMSYDKTATKMDHSMFNNVFVNRASYESFQKTGTWPEGTAIVLENRMAEGSKSINKHGQTQATQVMGLEVHVKDSAHIPLPGGWAFYSFNGAAPATRIDSKQDCYTCHEQHAAVDTTFVQFYPTLQPAAAQHGTFSKAYLKEIADPH